MRKAIIVIFSLLLVGCRSNHTSQVEPESINDPLIEDSDDSEIPFNDKYADASTDVEATVVLVDSFDELLKTSNSYFVYGEISEVTSANDYANEVTIVVEELLLTDKEYQLVDIRVAKNLVDFKYNTKYIIQVTETEWGITNMTNIYQGFYEEVNGYVHIHESLAGDFESHYGSIYSDSRVKIEDFLKLLRDYPGIQ